MFVRTPGDFGAIIRDRRRQLNLDQAKLAELIGVSRQWVVSIEQGRERAELGLVLRALDSLEICLNSSIRAENHKAEMSTYIDAIITAARKWEP